MSQCIKCKLEVGCSCNLDANLLCVNCSSNNIKEKATIVKISYNSSNTTKKRILGYI